MGDIHGQLRDMLLFLHCYGMPGDKGTEFVFNGDFVDRGAHQLEVIGVLLAFKVMFPDRVWLNRGNHEDRDMNSKYGFKKDCKTKLGSDRGPIVFEAMQAVFEQLPLACVISQRVLVVHGGVGRGEWSLDDLRRTPRPISSDDLQAPGNEWIWNILWSDPIEEDAGVNTFGVHPSTRTSTCVRFGWNITESFCQRNGLDLVVRSHQVKKNGFGFDVMHDDTLMRVFTARDYEHSCNDGAVLSISAVDQDLLTVRAHVIRSLSKS